MPLRRRRGRLLQRRCERRKGRRVGRCVRREHEGEQRRRDEEHERDHADGHHTRTQHVDPRRKRHHRQPKARADHVGCELAPPARAMRTVRLWRQQRVQRALDVLREQERVQRAVEDIAQQVHRPVQQRQRWPEGVVHPHDVAAAVRHRHRAARGGERGDGGGRESTGQARGCVSGGTATEESRLGIQARHAHSSETTRTIGNDHTSVTPRSVPMASSGPPAETASSMP